MAPAPSNANGPVTQHVVPTGQGLRRTQKRNERRKVSRRLRAQRASCFQPPGSQSSEEFDGVNEVDDNSPEKYDNIAYVEIECNPDYKPPPVPAGEAPKPKKRKSERGDHAIRTHIRFDENGDEEVRNVEEFPTSFEDRFAYDGVRPLPSKRKRKRPRASVNLVTTSPAEASADRVHMPKSIIGQSVHPEDEGQVQKDHDASIKCIAQLPEDISSLPQLNVDGITPGHVIAFQYLNLVGGMPSMSPHIAAKVLSVDEDGLQVQVATKDRATFSTAANEARFGRFMTTVYDEFAEEQDDTEGSDAVQLSFSELADPRLVISTAPTRSTKPFGLDRAHDDKGPAKPVPDMEVGQTPLPGLSKAKHSKRNQLPVQAGEKNAYVRKQKRDRHEDNKEVDGVAAFLKYLRPQS